VTPAEAIDLMQDAVWVLIKISGPAMMVGLVVGLVVSLIQTLTQLQEQTLVFIPKILAVFVSLVLFLPFMISTLIAFMEQIAGRIAGIE
jgi:flagellar biosynthetic protein FliQ